MALTKAQAKSLSILDVARSLGMEMRRSSHKEYYWKEHDSFKIDTTKNTWNWYSRGIYGDTIDLVQEMRQVTYGQAIAFLDHGDYPEAKKQENVRQPFKYTLSPYEEPFNEARHYLKTVRGLSDETIDFFFNRGMLAQARRRAKDGYAESVLVFKSYSRDGEMVGASLQGLTPNKDRYEGKGYLKQIMYQSEGISGLNVTIGSPKRLVVAEAPIDLMSYYELHKETLEDVRLVAMDGLKEGLISHYAMELLQDLGEIKDETFDYTKSKDLQIASNFLKNAAQQTTLFHNGAYQDLITLAVDNDQAGTDFLESLRDKDIPVIDARPPKEENQEKMDWNEYLQMQKENTPTENQTMKKTTKDQLALFDNLADLTPSKAKKKKQAKEVDGDLTSYGSFRIDDEFLESRYGTKPEEDTIDTITTAMKTLNNLSLEGIGVDNDPTECVHTSTVDVEGYQLDLAVYSPHTELEPHGRYDWSLLVLEKTEPLGFLAYGEDWFNNQVTLKEKLTDLQTWLDQGTVKKHLLTQQDYTQFLELLNEKRQEEEETKKAPEQLQEATVSISEQHKKIGHKLGDLPDNRQEAAPLPEATQSQPLNDLLPSQTQDQSLLHFTISNPNQSRRKAGYHLATKRDLDRVNNYAQGLQEAAQWYRDNLANSTISYVYKDETIKSPLIVQITFEEKQFMHLTGLFPLKDGQTAEKTLQDFAEGNGDFDHLMIANRGAAFQKLQVLPELKDMLRTDAFYFDHVSDIPRLHNINMETAIKSDEGGFVTAFRSNEEGLYPASLLELTPDLLDEFTQAPPGKTILGIYRDRDGQLEQVAINEDYVKDNGQAMLTTLQQKIESKNLENGGLTMTDTQKEHIREFFKTRVSDVKTDYIYLPNRQEDLGYYLDGYLFAHHYAELDMLSPSKQVDALMERVSEHDQKFLEEHFGYQPDTPIEEYRQSEKNRDRIAEKEEQDFRNQFDRQSFAETIGLMQKYSPEEVLNESNSYHDDIRYQSLLIDLEKVNKEPMYRFIERYINRDIDREALSQFSTQDFITIAKEHDLLNGTPSVEPWKAITVTQPVNRYTVLTDKVSEEFDNVSDLHQFVNQNLKRSQRQELSSLLSEPGQGTPLDTLMAIDSVAGDVEVNGQSILNLFPNGINEEATEIYRRSSAEIEETASMTSLPPEKESSKKEAPKITKAPNLFQRLQQIFTEDAKTKKAVLEEEYKDSDGDGISDEEELKQGTNPYDFRSTPSSKGVDENTLEPEETFFAAGSVAVADLIKNKDITGLNQHLKEGIKAYLNSENYKKFLTKMSQFNQYSSRNLRLILAQKPDASYLAPYNTWKKFDRHVKRGEKALSVIIPVTYVKKDQQGHPILDKNGKPETGLTFRLKPTTFDVSQTEGKAMPKAAEVKEQLTDLDYANLYRALMSIAKTNNVSVRFEEMERSTFGYYNPTENQIVLRSNEMNKSQIIKTFLHETAHSELHHNNNPQQEQLTKSTAELQAESVAYVVASYYGIDTADYSFDYLAGWSNDKETLADLEAQLDIVQQEAKSLMVRMDQELEQLRLVQQRQSQQQFEQKLQKYKDQTKQAVEDHKKEMKEEAQSKKEKGLSK